jgi:hypothetical protein
MAIGSLLGDRSSTNILSSEVWLVLRIAPGGYSELGSFLSRICSIIYTDLFNSDSL